jgi:hypothetical protein
MVVKQLKALTISEAIVNIIHSLFENYCCWIDGWSPAHYSFFIQAVLLFCLPTLFCAIAFQRGSRSVFVQTLAFIFGLFLATSIPVEQLIPHVSFFKAWLLIACLVLLLFLPGVLARLLIPELGRQRKLQTLFYAILLSLFLVNLVI